jgi:hypothetical protein
MDLNKLEQQINTITESLGQDISQSEFIFLLIEVRHLLQGITIF